MTGTPQPAVVLFVVDLPRMTRFYRDVAGCTVRSSSATHRVLDASGLELVLHEIRAGLKNPPQAGAPRVAEEAALKLCLPVPDLARTRTLAAELGGGLHAPSTEWDGDGYRACDGWDAEGNVVQFREPREPSV